MKDRYFIDWNGIPMDLNDVRYDFEEFCSTFGDADTSNEAFERWIDDWWLAFEVTEITKEEYEQAKAGLNKED